ncbi:hypothetical protein MVLG_00290 [Microbotryum lychnidis-dioicae p1A1 Lamole]|uniref:Uncharacterized protein n=2 Tax=Microbotryum TaxID=34416 RepID=U5GYM5_USTV1|nr:hypothetical protein MVLG_00290 [Microbotryum lychnidis-dioicae p1A1 Lamole]SGY62725.1 BQ5605_C007g04727 [Microbotryum silenes-dioicae]|eukprot:KDE09384.1 hypothetical protein MVLG_00290 [Microbotryum lychnidis-dioicae p1A1 Lamole]
MKVPNLLTFLIVSSVALASELRGDQRVKSSARQKRALAVDDPNNFNFFRSCAESCQYSPKSGHVTTAEASCYKGCMSMANQGEDS